MGETKNALAAQALADLRAADANLRTFITTPVTDAYYREEDKMMIRLRKFMWEDWSAFRFEDVLYLADIYTRLRAVPLHRVLGKMREVKP